MVDWYSEALARMQRTPGWVIVYAQYTGHFVDDFGNMVRVYAPNEKGIHEMMP